MSFAVLVQINWQRKLIIAFLSVLSFTASANNFNYNIVDIRIGLSPTTFGGKFSAPVTENSHILAKADTSFSDDWDTAIGIGFNGPVGNLYDIYGQFVIHNLKQENKDVNAFRDGWNTEINFGTRVWLFQNIELHAKIGRLIGSNSSDTLFAAGGRFHSTDQLSVGLDFENEVVYGSRILFVASFAY